MSAVREICELVLYALVKAVNNELAPNLRRFADHRRFEFRFLLSTQHRHFAGKSAAAREYPGGIWASKGRCFYVPNSLQRVHASEKGGTIFQSGSRTWRICRSKVANVWSLRQTLDELSYNGTIQILACPFIPMKGGMHA